MPLTREERKLLHQKSKHPTFGINEPDAREGNDGDISFRQVENSGTVQYVKRNGDWLPMSSSGNMPSSRSIQSSSSTSGGVTDHSDLSSLGVDDHPQYLLIDGTRAMNNVLTIGSDADGADRTVTWGHSTLKTIMGIDDSSDAFVINTDDAFDATLANNSFSIDASHNVIIAGGVTSGSSGYTVGSTVITDDSIVMTPSANDTLTISSSTNGASTIQTVDAAGSDAHITIQADGNVYISSNTSVYLHDGSQNVMLFDTANVKFKMMDDADTGDYFEISTAQHGATTITTIDDDATAANLTFDIDGNIDFKQTSGTTRYTFNLDSTPELDVTGNFTIDGSGTINIDSASTLTLNGASAVNIQEGGTNVINIDTNQYIYFHAYALSLYNNYALNNKADNYHFTTGNADYDQNYSIISYSIVSSSFNSSYGS